MPRRMRLESNTGVYHWIVRGMNKKKLFHDKEDYLFYKNLVFEYKSEYKMDIYHYCLMTNHVHKLLRSDDLKTLSHYSHYVQRRYAYYYCKKYKWNGSVFRSRYGSFPIQRDEYLLECGRYIERNPLKAKMIDRMGLYEYDSYKYYVEGTSDKLLTPSPAFLGLSDDSERRREMYRKYVCENRIQEEMQSLGLLSDG